MEWLEQTNAIVALLVTTGGTLIAIILYIVRARSGVSREISNARIEDRERVENLALRIGDLDRRLCNLERDIEALPTRQEFQGLHIDMIELKGAIALQAEQMRSQNEILMRVERMVTRHHDHLMNDGHT